MSQKLETGRKHGWFRSRVLVRLPLLALLLSPIALIVYLLEPSGVVVYDNLHMTGEGRFYGGGAYRRCVFGTSSTSLWALSADEFSLDDAIPLPGVYVRLPDKTTVLLSEFNPALASKHFELIPSNEFRKFPYKVFRGRFDTELDGCLLFDGDKLIAAELDGSGFSLGREQGGPFYSIPLTYRQMIELFGKPREIFQRKWSH